VRPEVRLGLSDEDRRYLSRRYDDRVQLPPHADDYLRPDQPRLCELTRAYASLDTPAVEHSQWTPGNVRDYVELRYFRGESMIQWHYRELPRATRLKLFAYLTHLQRLDHAGLLNTLIEDGQFGCWTYDFPGYPKVSRDLLDSVGELLFLDRHLSILSSQRLRVLDIGAGYGRLAHRMAGAVPGLADYGCLDAVPESTFVAEYYLGWRGCVPPARVIPLHELEGLRGWRFDLAVNVHSFSECTGAAVAWWVGWLAELGVPNLFVVPNEPEGLLSREIDGTRRDLMPVLDRAGYRLTAREPVISDAAVREMVRINDHFHLFSLEPGTGL
jgi:SAM-dependent methyltransferase